MKRFLPIPIFIVIVSACVENPFFKDDSISDERNIITGTIGMEEVNTTERIILWDELSNTLTNPNKDGKFMINFPSPAELDGGNISGEIQVFAYASNYHVDSVSIPFINNRITKNNGVIDEDNKLVQPLFLSQTFNVNVNAYYLEFVNEKIDRRYRNINVVVTFRVFNDTLTISSYKPSLEGIISRFIIRNMDSGQLRTIILNEDKLYDNFLRPGSYTFTSTIDVDISNIEPGTYEIYPWFIVKYESIPEKMQKLILPYKAFDVSYVRYPLIGNSDTIRVTKPVLQN